jgi:hypothetical protein
MSDRAAKGGGTSKPLVDVGFTFPNAQWAGGYSAGITLGTGADWFGPLNPQAPSAPPEVTGRRFDYPSGYNLNILPRAYEPIQFSDLRAMADGYDVLRTIIETRKDQMAVGQWSIKPRLKPDGTPMTSPNDPIITEISEFFEMPDGENFWDAWLRMLLEDLFVCDAPSLFIQRNRGGKMIALPQVDGATIKRVIDDWGRTPLPPAPAYQQDLHGLPAVNYTTDDMIYRPRNQRVHKVYGYSPVEQILMTVNIALRRQVFLLQYYTEGNVPEALIGAPDGWTVKQIEEFQLWFDSVLQGNTANRRRLHFVPGGVAKQFLDLKSGALTDQTDEWLTRICCFAFSISPTPFIKAMNRATADSVKEQATEEGLAPNQRWVKQLVDFIIRKEWFKGKSHTVEFAWEIDDDVDPNSEMATLTGYVKAGVLAVNEARSRLGEDPTPGGDKPKALIGTGWVPLDPEQEAKEIQLKTPAQLRDPNAPPSDGSKSPPGKKPDSKQVESAEGEGADDQANAGSEDSKKPTQAPATGKKEVGKSAVPFGKGLLACDNPLRKASKKRIIDLDPESSTIRKHRAALVSLWKKHLATVGKDVARQVRVKLDEASKAEAPDSDQVKRAAEIANGVDLSGLSILIDPTAEELKGAAQDAAGQVIVQFQELDPHDLFERVNARAADWASERAAELVGMRVLDDGSVIENPNADYAITDSTRDRLKQIIADGLANGDSNDDITDEIEAEGFDSDRAELISFTEISRAVGQGALESYKAAEEDGVDVQKQWLTAEDDLVDEDICQPNSDQGPIDLDDQFDSGDDAPPGHPRCRCRLVGVVGGQEDDNAVEDTGED